MVTDIFLNRASGSMLGDHVPRPIAKLFGQVAGIVRQQLIPLLSDREAFFQEAHDALAMELGGGQLAPGSSWEEICGQFVCSPYDLWNDAHGTVDLFVKTRLSLIELIFRNFEKEFEAGGSLRSASKEAVQGVTDEFRFRLAESGIGLCFANGRLLPEGDHLTSQEVSGPFWEILQDERWSNVDSEMREALDARARGERDAPFKALRALESALKIVGEARGVSRGSERGAADHVDNLVSARNGRFIDPWEADLLKMLFSRVRNPQGHGAGSRPPLVLSPAQSQFIIDSAMVWVKSLVTRDSA